MSKKTKTIVLIDAVHGINYHRFLVPILHLSKQGYDISVCKTIGEIHLYDPSTIKQVWTSRVITADNYTSFKEWCKKHDIRVVIDVDDYWYVDDSSPNKITFRKGLSKMIEQTLSIADVITTPNEYLGKLVNKEAKSDAEIVIIENGIELNEPHWIDTQEKYNVVEGKDIVKFGYLGALGHEKDVALVGKPPRNAFVVTTDMGNYANMLNADYVVPSVEHSLYHRHYKFVDVSLAPLQKTKFNRCKSSLKIAEAVASKTAIIVSDINIYSDLIDNGVNGYVCKTYNDWKNAIRSLNDMDKAKEFAQALHDKYKERFDIETINKVRIEKLGLEMRQD